MGTLFSLESDASQPTTSEVGVGNLVWNDDLTRRLKVLYHARPIFDMRRSLMHSEECSEYDVSVIGFKLLDLLAEAGVLGDGLSGDEVVDRLVPLLEVMDQVAGRDRNVERARRVAQKVLDYLLNRADDTRQFKINYLATVDDDGVAETRVLSFRLVVEIAATRGVILRLTPEAGNLLFRMLAVDLESSMAATEAILEHLLRRGRFDEALQSAQQARSQAGLYTYKIKSFRQNVRNDIQLELGSDALRVALAFIRERQDKDQQLLGQISAKVDELRRQGMEQDEVDFKFRRLHEIEEIIYHCAELYANLGLDILDAQCEFTMEHGRQSLRPKMKFRRTNLMTEQVPKVFSAPLASVEDGLLAFNQRLFGYAQPERFSLAQLLSPLKRILQDSEFTQDSATTVLDKPAPHVPTISHEDWMWASQYLRGLDGRRSLGDLLAKAVSQDKADGPRRLAILIEVIRTFAFSSDKRGVPLRVGKGDRPLEMKWADMDCYGDDLWVEPLGLAEQVEQEGA